VLVFVANKIELDQKYVKKEQANSKFFFDLNNITCEQKDLLVNYIYHIGYKIKGEFFPSDNVLKLTYSNSRLNYSKEIYDFISKKHSTYTFYDYINLSDNKITRRKIGLIGEYTLKKLSLLKLTAQSEDYKIYFAKDDLRDYIINTEANLNVVINPNIWHNDLTEGIQSIETLDYKLSLKKHKEKQ
jgi:hypothetical protein